MKRWLLCRLLLCAAVISPSVFPGERPATYHFATKAYLIQMSVAFFEPYVGSRLAFSSSVDPRKKLCYGTDGATGNCTEQFMGAVAVATYSVKLANGARPKFARIRERVTVSGQSSGLPERPPFSMTQQLIKGIGSDIQVFGYNETALTPAERSRIRRQAQTTWWRTCRQELYMDDETEPFAIVGWKYTLERITPIWIYSPHS